MRQGESLEAVIVLKTLRLERSAQAFPPGVAGPKERSRDVKSFRIALPMLLTFVVSGCSGSSKSPTSPTPTPTVPATLTKPTADAPADGAQLDNVRPTVTVVNGTSNQSGAKT